MLSVKQGGIKYHFKSLWYDSTGVSAASFLCQLEAVFFDFINRCSKHVVLDTNKTAGEKPKRQLHKNAASNIEQVLEATPNKAPTIRPPTSHQENYQS